MPDRPDYMQDVERTPIQALPYQAFNVLNIYQNALANATSQYTWAIPNDGYNYAIDSIFAFWLMNNPAMLYVEWSPTTVSPTWQFVGINMGEYSMEVVPSKLGSLSLKYPAQLRVSLVNSHNTALYWFGVVTYYTYQE